MPEAVGIIKERVNPSGHIGVENHVLLRGHHIHTLPALVAPVEGGHYQPGHGDGQHELELLRFLDRADHHEGDEEGDDVENQEAQREAAAEPVGHTAGEVCSQTAEKGVHDEA